MPGPHILLFFEAKRESDIDSSMSVRIETEREREKERGRIIHCRTRVIHVSRNLNDVDLLAHCLSLELRLVLSRLSLLELVMSLVELTGKHGSLLHGTLLAL